jgi:predicted RNase H-like nuclease (RuvC/YqgF family)
MRTIAPASGDSGDPNEKIKKLRAKITALEEQRELLEAQMRELDAKAIKLRKKNDKKGN